MCDGSEVLIADYPLLFNAIGYIGGDDVLTGYFRLPDMRGVVPAGYNPDLVGSSNPLAGNFGDQVGAPKHFLTVDEMPSHTHNSVNYVAGYTGGSQSGLQTLLSGTSSSSVVAAVKSTGGGQGHSSVQPTKLYNWLVKAKNVVTLGGYTEDFEVQGDLNVIGAITQNNTPIVERGTNYVKLYDGTAIFRKTISVTTAIDTVYGNWYESPLMSFGNFDSGLFIETPHTFIQSTGVACWVESLNGTTKSYIGQAYLSRPDQVASRTYNLSVLAIGRWK